MHQHQHQLQHRELTFLCIVCVLEYCLVLFAVNRNRKLFAIVSSKWTVKKWEIKKGTVAARKKKIIKRHKSGKMYRAIDSRRGESVIHYEAYFEAEQKTKNRLLTLHYTAYIRVIYPPFHPFRAAQHSASH